MSNNSSVKYIPQLVREYKQDRVALYSAAIAYHAIFSLAPIVILVTSFWGFWIGRERAMDISVTVIGRLFGETGIRFYESALFSAFVNTSGLFALLAVILVVYGTMRLFKNAHSAFADIFNFEIEGETIIEKTVHVQAWSAVYLVLLLVIVFIFALLNIVVNVSSKFLVAYLAFSVPVFLVVALNYIGTYLFTIFIFATIYRFTSRRRVSWVAAISGGVIGGFLFTFTSTLFGLYVFYSSVIPLYGAASFLVAVVLWTYYAVQALLLGAEAAKVHECRYPRHRQKVCL